MGSSDRPLSFAENYDEQLSISHIMDNSNQMKFVAQLRSGVSSNSNSSLQLLQSTTDMKQIITSSGGSSGSGTVSKNKLLKNKKYSSEVSGSHNSFIQSNNQVCIQASCKSASSNQKNIKVLKNKNKITSTIKSFSEEEDEEADKDSFSLVSQDSKMGLSQSQWQQKVGKDSKEGGWEILEGLKSGQSYDQTPNKFEGFMMKNRKWPMKGWHKRYFKLDQGFLTYGKSPLDLEKGRFHGRVDVGLSVVVCKARGFRIDMDADDTIHHLKTKSHKEFEDWKFHLKGHRLFRQNAISSGCLASQFKKALCLGVSPDDLSHGSSLDTELSCSFLDSNNMEPSTEVGRVMREGDLEKKVTLLTSEELSEVQMKLCDFRTLLSDLSLQHKLFTSSTCLQLNTFRGRKDKLKKGYIGKTKKEKRTKDTLYVPEPNVPLVKCSSNPSLALDEEATVPPITSFHLSSTSPFILPSTPQSSIHSNINAINFMHDQVFKLSELIFNKLNKISNQMVMTERTREDVGFSSPLLSSLKIKLAEFKEQNGELRSKLNRIHQESAPSILSPPPCFLPLLKHHRSPRSSESLDSQSNEFYDAADQLEPSSEGSEEEEEEDEFSDNENKVSESFKPEIEQCFNRFQLRRRSRLPSPSVEGDVSLWGLLRKNIGKDLSKISMPVSMNEPLNALQRLCEDLEYSELLERANQVEDPFERMVWVAVFSVSCYSSTLTRASRKPFNPLLGETFEMDRVDKGWRFIAEQVRHHPPVSACHCESKDFVFWQDMQVKSKFWGKSMEVQPVGVVNLRLNKHDEHYTWNKATSCIHNIVAGQRWVEHYGEVLVKNHSKNIVCKLNYVKSSYFSTKKYEVYGQVSEDEEGAEVAHHLFGRWNEIMFHGQTESNAKVIWRPGALPPDYQLYYGFTKFAMELNEIDPDQLSFYPPTDTRFRPDQRMLEAGKLDEAEAEKRRLEQKQRDLKKMGKLDESFYQPKWFRWEQDLEGKDCFCYSGSYWLKRKNPGFSKITFPELW